MSRNRFEIKDAILQRLVNIHIPFLFHLHPFILLGHTAGLYTSDVNTQEAKRREEAFLKEVPVHRILVNAPTSIGAIGGAMNFHIDPSFTL